MTTTCTSARFLSSQRDGELSRQTCAVLQGQAADIEIHAKEIVKSALSAPLLFFSAANEPLA